MRYGDPLGEEYDDPIGESLLGNSSLSLVVVMVASSGGGHLV